MTLSNRTTYATATRGYDAEFERALADAIATAIATTSIVTDAPVMAIRTGETASALITALAAVLAMSPAAVRSPSGKRLRRRIAQAERDPAVQEFLRRSFNGDDVGGRA